LENHDYLIQPAVCRQGIDGLDLAELYVHNKIKNVSFMKDLKILDASYFCRIEQNSIVGLDLVELYVHNNIKITNIFFM
jgi:hypothetical protein